MSFTIGTPQPGRPAKPDAWSALSALLKSMEIGESRTVPIVDSANTRNETGRQALTALRRYAAEQGCAIGLPGVENTENGFILYFTKKAKRSETLVFPEGVVTGEREIKKKRREVMPS